MYNIDFEIAEKLLNMGYKVFVVKKDGTDVIFIKKGNDVYEGYYCSEYIITSDLCRHPEKSDFYITIGRGTIYFKRVSSDILDTLIERYMKPTKVVLIPSGVIELVLQVILERDFKIYLRIFPFEDAIQEAQELLKECKDQEEIAFLKSRIKELEKSKKWLQNEILEELSEYIEDVFYENEPELYSVDFWDDLSRDSDTKVPIPFKKIESIWHLRFQASIYRNEGYILKTDSGWFFIWIRGYFEGYAVDIYELDLTKKKVFQIVCIYKREYSQELGVRLIPIKCEKVPIKASISGWEQVVKEVKKTLEEVENHG